jgi:hypothetical protein
VESYVSSPVIDLFLKTITPLYCLEMSCIQRAIQSMALIAVLHIDDFRFQRFNSASRRTESVEEKKETKECEEDNPRE